MVQSEHKHATRPVPASFTGRQDIDLDAVREILSHFTYSDHEEAQELILSACQEINHHFGWVSPEAAELVADHLGTTTARVYAILSFYADFRTEKRGHHHMLLCHGMSCYVGGSSKLVQTMVDEFGVADGETTADEQISVQVANFCLGVCDCSPVVKIDDVYHKFVTPEKLTQLVNDAISGKQAKEASEANHG